MNTASKIKRIEFLKKKLDYQMKERERITNVRNELFQDLLGYGFDKEWLNKFIKLDTKIGSSKLLEQSNMPVAIKIEILKSDISKMMRKIKKDHCDCT